MPITDPAVHTSVVIPHARHRVVVGGWQTDVKVAGAASERPGRGGVADVAKLFGAQVIAPARQLVVVERPAHQVAIGAHADPGLHPPGDRRRRGRHADVP
jgi:hypothetical protein